MADLLSFVRAQLYKASTCILHLSSEFAEFWVNSLRENSDQLTELVQLDEWQVQVKGSVIGLSLRYLSDLISSNHEQEPESRQAWVAQHQLFSSSAILLCFERKQVSMFSFRWQVLGCCCCCCFRLRLQALKHKQHKQPFKSMDFLSLSSLLHTQTNKPTNTQLTQRI